MQTKPADKKEKQKLVDRIEFIHLLRTDGVHIHIVQKMVSDFVTRLHRQYQVQKGMGLLHDERRA